MKENNKNNIDIEHQETQSCYTCPYQNEYFIDNDDEGIMVKCMAEYFSVINVINDMKNKFSPEQIYLFVPRLQKGVKDYSFPQFVINTYDGIKNHYQAEIEEKIYENLLQLLARDTLAKVLMPIAVCIRGKTVSFISTSDKQYQIAYDIFVKNSHYEPEDVDISDEFDGVVTNDNELMTDLKHSNF